MEETAEQLAKEKKDQKSENEIGSEVNNFDKTPKIVEDGGLLLVHSTAAADDERLQDLNVKEEGDVGLVMGEGTGAAKERSQEPAVGREGDGGLVMGDEARAAKERSQELAAGGEGDGGLLEEDGAGAAGLVFPRVRDSRASSHVGDAACGISDGVEQGLQSGASRRDGATLAEDREIVGAGDGRGRRSKLQLKPLPSRCIAAARCITHEVYSGCGRSLA